MADLNRAFSALQIRAPTNMMPRRSALNTLPRSRRMRIVRSGAVGWTPMFQHLVRLLILIRRVARGMIKKLTYQSWAGDVPNWSLGGFMSDGSGDFNTGWRNRGQGILRLL